MKKKIIFVAIVVGLIVATAAMTLSIRRDFDDTQIENPNDTIVIGDQYEADKVHEDLRINIETEDTRDVEIVENADVNNTDNTDNTNSTVAIVDNEVFAGNTDPSTAYEQWKAETNEEAIANGYAGEIDTRTREEVLVDSSREIGLSDDEIKALWFYDGNSLGYNWPESREFINDDQAVTENSDTSENISDTTPDTTQPDNSQNVPEKQPVDDITTTDGNNNAENSTTEDYYNYNNVWTPPADFVAPGTVLTEDNIITGEGEVVEFEDDDDIRWE